MRTTCILIFKLSDHRGEMRTNLVESAGSSVGCLSHLKTEENQISVPGFQGSRRIPLFVMTSLGKPFQMWVRWNTASQKRRY